MCGDRARKREVIWRIRHRDLLVSRRRDYPRVNGAILSDYLSNAIEYKDNTKMMTFSTQAKTAAMVGARRARHYAPSHYHRGTRRHHAVHLPRHRRWLRVDYSNHL